MTILRSMLRAALILGGFAVLGVGMVSASFGLAESRIQQNKRTYLLRSLHTVVHADQHDNDIFADVIQITSARLLGTSEPMFAYRARKDGQPVAVVLTSVAPDGYNGSIRLLVGIYTDGTLAGVRVVEHRETPGLGDAIETRKSDWILGFDGRSLDNPDAAGWSVKRDGGEFDQLTGATITPRAVVRAVRNALEYFAENRQRLLAIPLMPEGSSS